jgi:hypothetical protein
LLDKGSRYKHRKALSALNNIKEHDFIKGFIRGIRSKNNKDKKAFKQRYYNTNKEKC